MIQKACTFPDDGGDTVETEDGEIRNVFELEFTELGVKFRCRHCKPEDKMNTEVGVMYGATMTDFVLSCPNCGATATFTGALAIVDIDHRWEKRVKLLERRAEFTIEALKGRMDGCL